MQSKLLSCPFCGGEAQLKQTGSKQITIRCNSCPAKMVQGVLRYSLEWLEESMIGDWNKRAAQQSAHPTPCPECGKVFSHYTGCSRSVEIGAIRRG